MFYPDYFGTIFCPCQSREKWYYVQMLSPDWLLFLDGILPESCQKFSALAVKGGFRRRRAQNYVYSCPKRKQCVSVQCRV